MVEGIQLYSKQLSWINRSLSVMCCVSIFAPAIELEKDGHVAERELNEEEFKGV